MLKVYANCTTTYVMRLDEDDEIIINEYAKEHNCSLEEAVQDLAENEAINLFWDCDATDEQFDEVLEVIEEE